MLALLLCTRASVIEMAGGPYNMQINSRCTKRQPGQRRFFSSLGIQCPGGNTTTLFPDLSFIKSVSWIFVVLSFNISLSLTVFSVSVSNKGLLKNRLLLDRRIESTGSAF
ncbi:hypothetical protein MRX96_038566 [Rhipicephalus microplus]